MRKIQRKGFFGTRFFQGALALFCMSFLAGCEHDEGVQTHVFIPKVTPDETGNCYHTHGLRMVRWANLIRSHREQKPVVEALHLNTAQKNELIYSHIPKGFLEDKDPIWEVAAGVQNIVSIPVTAMIAATTLPGLKREQAKCLKRQQQNLNSTEIFNAI